MCGCEPEHILLGLGIGFVLAIIFIFGTIFFANKRIEHLRKTDPYFNREYAKEKRCKSTPSRTD